MARSSPLLVPGGRNWSIALAIPEEDLIGAARVQMLWLIGLLLALFVAAGFRMAWLTRRLSGGLSALAAAARDVGKSVPLGVPDAGVEEIASVGTALVHRR